MPCAVGNSHKPIKVSQGYYCRLTGANPQCPMENEGGEGEWVTLLTFNYCQGGLQQSTNFKLLWWNRSVAAVSEYLNGKQRIAEGDHSLECFKSLTWKNDVFLFLHCRLQWLFCRFLIARFNLVEQRNFLHFHNCLTSHHLIFCGIQSCLGENERLNVAACVFAWFPLPLYLGTYAAGVAGM